jgi:hypothetical protein
MVFPPAEQSNMLSALSGALGAGYLQVDQLLVHQAEGILVSVAKLSTDC